MRTLSLAFTHRDDVMVARCSKSAGFSTHDDDDLTLQFTVSYVVWTSDLLTFAMEEFDLTEAETKVVQQLLSGASQVEAAVALGKSRETVKVQAKSILRKFGVAQMADVQSIAPAYAFLGQRPRVDVVAAPNLSGHTTSGSRMMDVGGMRRVEVWEYGDPKGFPILFWHGLVLGPFFTEKMIKAFANKGLRIVSISRPGFGQSSPPPCWTAYDHTCRCGHFALCAQTA